MKCQICSKKTEHLERHHIIPVSRGGGDDDSNIIFLCAKCHGNAHNVSFSQDRSGLIHEGIAKARSKNEIGKEWLERNVELVNDQMDKLFDTNIEKYNLMMALIEDGRIYASDFMDLCTKGKFQKTIKVTFFKC